MSAVRVYPEAAEEAVAMDRRLGLAMYLADCLNGSADFPTLDVL